MDANGTVSHEACEGGTDFHIEEICLVFESSRIRDEQRRVEMVEGVMC